MIREAIGVGETEVQAQEDACRQLGVETYEAEFEIIQRAEKKILGLFGGCPAKVRAFIKASPADAAEDFLKNVLNAMGLENITIGVKENEDNGVEINLEGEEVGSVIGRRGETLDALQYLTSLVYNKDREDYVRVNLDTENYRAKREETLVNLAKKIAGTVSRTGRSITLEPMNPNERRIIHSTLQSYDYINTYSIGEDPNRKIVVSSKNSSKGNRGGYRRNYSSYKREETTVTTEE